jgi:hypothetical protein
VQHLECSMFDGGWTLFAQLLQSAFPFYCWNSNNLRLVFLCMTFPIFIFVMLGVGKRRVKIPWDVSVVSPLFQPDYRFWFENEVKVYEFVLRNGYWLSTTLSICCSLLVDHNAWKLLSTELLVGRGWILKEVISDLCIEVLCTMRVIGLIRNFWRGKLVLVSSHSRTFLVRNSEL